MKQKVSLSNFSSISSAIIIIALIVMMFFIPEPKVVIFFGVILVGMCLFGLYYMPLSLSADKDYLYINRPFRIKAIPLNEITSVKAVPFLWKTIRLCGSGGWLGYWGWFASPGQGRYFAYFGNRNNCFLVTLRSGKKYMLGCDNRQEMIAYLQKHIK